MKTARQPKDPLSAKVADKTATPWAKSPNGSSLNLFIPVNSSYTADVITVTYFSLGRHMN